jgi:hypothetical protein
MAQFKDLSGQKFNRLLVIQLGTKTKGGRNRWLCRCDCGEMTQTATTALKQGLIKSCGCLQKEIAAAVQRKHGHSGQRTKGGKQNQSSEYRTWTHIKSRCFNPRVPAYPRYGGRGITMHPEWVDSFEKFFEYIGPRPSPMHTLDRLENDGHYEPGNVGWRTYRQQNNNRSDTIFLTIDSEKICLEFACERYGVNKGRVKTVFYKYDITCEQAFDFVKNTESGTLAIPWFKQFGIEIKERHLVGGGTVG